MNEIDKKQVETRMLNLLRARTLIYRRAKNVQAVGLIISLVFPIVGLIVGVIYAYVVQHKMHELSETTYRAAALRNAALVESLTALETIKTQGAEGVVQNKWERTSAFLSRTNAQMRLLSASATNGAATITQIVSVALIVAGVYLIHERMLTMGGLIAVNMLGGRAIAPLGQAVGMLMQFQNARTSLNSIDNYMKMPVEHEAGREYVARPDLRGARIQLRAHGDKPLAGVENHAEIL